MNYEEALRYIHETPKFSRELGNRLLKKLLGCLENPQEGLRFIHIAGTNGKGSAAAMLAEILRCSGFRTGLFTSPYIERFNERIRVDGAEIPDTELARIITRLRDTIEKADAPVSEFALDTAAAFCYFQACGCDVVVLETGLGGRLDATNVIRENLVTILTSIGLDHTQYLGETIQEITAEKCGIFKPGCPVVTAPRQTAEAIAVIRRRAAEMGILLYETEPAEKVSGGVCIRGTVYPLGLQGSFQADNAATAVEAVRVLRKRGMNIPESAVRRGLAQVKHMARFERFGDKVILDGCHNVQAAVELCSSLSELERPVYLCTAMMEDKDYQGCARILARAAAGVVATQLEMPRCCPAALLAQAFMACGIPAAAEASPEAALEKALALAGKEGVVCICGSLFLAGRLRPLLRKNIEI